MKCQAWDPWRPEASRSTHDLTGSPKKKVAAFGRKKSRDNQDHQQEVITQRGVFNHQVCWSVKRDVGGRPKQVLLLDDGEPKCCVKPLIDQTLAHRTRYMIQYTITINHPFIEGAAVTCISGDY